MKAAFSLLVLVATIGLARAGSFAGPPPFTNGSPLQSGTDGTYQAVASGTNLTGVFSFVISGGIQTSDFERRYQQLGVLYRWFGCSGPGSRRDF